MTYILMVLVVVAVTVLDQWTKFLVVQNIPLYGAMEAVPGLFRLTQSLLIPLILLLASAVIAWKHKDNYVRMYHGTEIRFRKAGRGDYRVK